MVKIGHLESGLPSSSPNLLAAFRQGLRELGYVEGQNVVIVSRYGEGRKSVFLSLPRSLSQYGVPIDCGEFPREWLLFHVTVLLPSGRGTSQTRALSDAPDTYIKVTLRRIVGFRFAIICEWGACWVGGMTHTALAVTLFGDASVSPETRESAAPAIRIAAEIVNAHKTILWYDSAGALTYCI
jgi:hypothetical protein